MTKTVTASIETKIEFKHEVPRMEIEPTTFSS